MNSDQYIALLCMNIIVFNHISEKVGLSVLLHSRLLQWNHSERVRIHGLSGGSGGQTNVKQSVSK